MSTQYANLDEIEAGHKKHEAMKRECESLARMCARSLHAGAPTIAADYAARFMKLDDERFEFLLALSAATHELCEFAS